MADLESQDFYDAVGRVATAGAQVEWALAHLLSTIKNAESDTFSRVGGNTWNQLEGDVERAATAPALTDRARQWLADMLAESKALRPKRNDVLHAIAWLAPDVPDGPMTAVKPTRRQYNRVTQSEWSIDGMHTLAAQLYQLAFSLNGLAMAISFDLSGINAAANIDPSSYNARVVNPHDPSTWPATDT